MVADREHPPAVRRLTPHAVRTHWIQSVQVERAEEDNGSETGGGSSVPRHATPGQAITLQPRVGVTFMAGLWAPRDRSRQCPGESAPADDRHGDERSNGSASVTEQPSDRLNPPGMPCGSTRLPLNGFTYS